MPQADPAPVKVVGVADMLNAALVCQLPLPSSARAQIDMIANMCCNAMYIQALNEGLVEELLQPSKGAIFSRVGSAPPHLSRTGSSVQVLST